MSAAAAVALIEARDVRLNSPKVQGQSKVGAILSESLFFYDSNCPPIVSALGGLT